MAAGANVMTTLVCPILGLVICLFMWFSPFPAIWKARVTRDIGSLNPLPFVITILNCVGWTMYSCLTKDVYIFLGNISGLVLGLFYTITCMTVIAKKKGADEFSNLYLMVEGLLLFAFFFWSLVGFLCVTIFNGFSDPNKQAAAMVGMLSCAFSIAYYAAPLSTMYGVISNRDSSSLYLPMILVNLINALLWFSYGAFGVQDANIWIPNGLGIILACCQMTLVFLFKKGTFWQTLIGAVPSSKEMTQELDSNRSTSAIKMPHTLPDESYVDEEELLDNMQSSTGRDNYTVGTNNPLWR